MPPRRVVLVVEDDAAIRELIVRTLSTRYTVHQAGDGFAAAELLGQLRSLDLLICDVMMPTVDGLTLVRVMRTDRALHTVPVIFISAKVSPDDVIRGIAAGARHYLPKPFSIKDLMSKVEKALGG